MASSPGTNFYFNNFFATGEQNLLEELNIEAIKIYGIDLYYLPRTLVSFDPVYGEDDISEYNAAIPIEMYIKSVDGFEGDGVYLSKFGLEIRDQITFTVARRVFENNITLEFDVTQSRPFESDLLYYPLNKKLFQIRFVNYLPIHYPLGALQTYDLVCELFEYSNERINTGITDIDELQTKFSTNILDYSIIDENGNYLVSENVDYVVQEQYGEAQANVAVIDSAANTVQTAANTFLDWSETDPFSGGFW